MLGGKLSGSYDSLDDAMRAVLSALLKDQPQFQATRGKFTELFGCCLHLRNPRARLSRSEGRSKVFSAIGELMWYLSGETKLTFIDYYLPNRYQQESDDQINVRSGYGERLLSFNGINQLQNVIDLLNSKPSSRRAVIQLFDASDIAASYQSVPCTNTLQFIGREGRLHMLASMRSNDAFFGLPHDVFTFTMLQELVARSVDMEVGEYKHCVGSLHLYDDQRPGAAQYLAEGFQSHSAMPPMPNGDPRAAIDELKAYEHRLRQGGTDLPPSGWDPYWQSIGELLAAFRASKNKNLPALQELMERLRPTVFKMFVEAKVDSLEAEGSALARS